MRVHVVVSIVGLLGLGCREPATPATHEPAAAAPTSAESTPIVDPCVAFADKAGPIFELLAQRSGKPTAEVASQMTQTCHQAPDRFGADPMYSCVMDAADDDAVRTCFTDGIAKYRAASIAAEAKLQLAKIGRAVQEHAAENGGGILVGKQALTPTKPCCEQADAVCATDPAMWTGVWTKLGVGIDGRHRFQYGYSGSAREFVATAVGDPECDGTAMTFELRGSVGADGSLQVGEVVGPREPE